MKGTVVFYAPVKTSGPNTTPLCPQIDATAAVKRGTGFSSGPFPWFVTQEHSYSQLHPCIEFAYRKALFVWVCFFQMCKAGKNFTCTDYFSGQGWGRRDLLKFW